MKKSLIILDWDDTLFPTTWTTKESITFTPNNNHNHLVKFAELDTILYKFLLNCRKYATIIIVTNASNKWIAMTLTVLPNTKKAMQKIRVISARDEYKKYYPTNVGKWKELAFNILSNDTYNNIISVGDAEYEFNALINLSKNKSNSNKYLKSVRFIKSPTYKLLIDQLCTLNKNIQEICKKTKHLDLLFE